jgi:hypothetical protein
VASLRTELDDLARIHPERARAELVFFQHDEIIVHAPEPSVPDVVAALGRAGSTATRLVLGSSPPIPLRARVTKAYSDKEVADDDDRADDVP